MRGYIHTNKHHKNEKRIAFFHLNEVKFDQWLVYKVDSVLVIYPCSMALIVSNCPKSGKISSDKNAEGIDNFRSWKKTMSLAVSEIVKGASAIGTPVVILR